MSWLPVVYCLIAILWSSFLACFAFAIHNGALFREDQPRNFLQSVHYYRNPRVPRSRKCQQWVLNVAGSMIGFAALWYVVDVRWVWALPAEIEWAEGALLLIAFYGITGYLPYILLLKFGPAWLRGGP